MCHFLRTLLGRTRVHVVTKWGKDSGAELLEAAFVIPVMLMLLVGIITFGRAWNVYQTITRAAREGARELVLTSCALCGSTSYTASDVQTGFVNPALTAANLHPSRVSGYTTKYVWMDPNDSPPYICGVQISFTYPYTLSLPFTSINLSTIDLSTTVQMRMENQPTTCSVGNPVP